MFLHRAINVLLLGSLLVMALAFWRKDVPPGPERLAEALLAEPEQRPARAAAKNTSVNGVAYRIQPRYSYDLSGLVVSLHHADSWWDYAHKEWNDHLNLVDLCVVWGGNAQSGAYRKIDFHNTQWECWASSSSAADWQAFNAHEMSNNHLITDDPAIARRMKALRVGDQVRVRGYLAEYSTYDAAGRQTGHRGTSTVRTDSGPNACETVYVEELEILESSNRGWRTAGKAAIWVFFLSLLAWAFAPVKFND
jgi:hypothetical protein